MRILLLDTSRHDRGGFACGNAGLDDYLKRYAGQSVRQNLAQVYVGEGENGQVLGYYTLSAASIRHEEMPEELMRRLPKYPVPAVLIGRMASDQKARNSDLRIGSNLLVHALKQALRAADTIGIQCVIVDSKPEAVDFYRRFGFMSLKQDGLKLYLPITTIKKMEQRND
ncbi:MAG: N-acetyltransferase [Synechococcaceae cyanobacterium SM2_3_2]|nr:N-acetyltransferase [Synechococcaceae cyanobacterium SM2_3_2]